MFDEPIVKEVDDQLSSLGELRSSLPAEESEKLFDFPIVYIHNWKYNKYLYDAYVGEANDVIVRTQQHFQSNEGWHEDFKKDHDCKKLFVIGHPHFNKSLTLDVENRLIQYMSCMRPIHRLRNGRGNPQYKYYPKDEFDLIFHSIWGKLNAARPDLFVPEQEIHDSALFKCSPLHQLTTDQIAAKQSILNVIEKARKRKGVGNLVVVEGEAGTGKSVLMSSLFYDLAARAKEDPQYKYQKIRFIINHKEQLDNFNSIFRRLGLSEDGNIVVKASTFINQCKKSKDLIDVAFIDEAHLLSTQGNQGYSGEDQLEDILTLAKTVVIVFDEHQILTREQYVEQSKLLKRRDKAKLDGLYVPLKKQLRIIASAETNAWIDQFTNELNLLPLPVDPSYDLKIFGDVSALYDAIKARAAEKEGRLSRVLASYDWPYNGTANRKPSNYEVEIGSWRLPWNYETSRKFSKAESSKIKDLSWAEQDHTIGEVGSTFTIQGFDLTYAGVILGPSISWDKAKSKIAIKGSESKNKKVTSRRTCENGEKIDIANYLVQHELRVLMTRGVKGMYIYAVDTDLRNELLKRQAARS